MKKLFLSVFVCLVAFVCHAQELTEKTRTLPKADRLEMAQANQFAIYPGCEDKKTNATQQKCFAQAVAKHVNINFNTTIAKELELEDIVKMHATFNVSEEGNIIDIKPRTPHPALDEEIRRVLNLLPTMKPATFNGKPTKVSFTLPIVFSI